ncbi:MAG TPA: hypothetical protein ENH85_03140 [Candidatus Scalindua sp.]|nr:hypothetical protein [Candidatus Scalindua sp.]
MNQLQIGQILYGYCGGFFGRESYEDKRIEAIGFDWVVVREIDGGGPDFGYTQDGSNISEPLWEYTTKPPDES